jgi:aminoglycoside phosphotransferase
MENKMKFVRVCLYKASLLYHANKIVRTRIIMSSFDETDCLVPELGKMLEGSVLTENIEGCSNSTVWRIEGNLAAHLKITPKDLQEGLGQERDALLWLFGKVPVPEILYYSTSKAGEYLLCSTLPGLPCSHPEMLENPELIVRIMAQGLRRIHSLPISTCPLNQRLETKLKVAERRVSLGLVDEGDFDPASYDKSASKLLLYLQSNRTQQEDLVVTHGDYCLPNCIVNDERLSGFVDLGRAGVADRYQDIALVVRSIRYNLDWQGWVDVFLSEYGIEEPDIVKMNYYALLDELF